MNKAFHQSGKKVKLKIFKFFKKFIAGMTKLNKFYETQFLKTS